MTADVLQNKYEERIVVQPARRWVLVDLAELWRYRELLYFLAWRDVKIRYKQTVLGAAWAVIQPVFLMIVFTLFFGRLAKVPSDGYPYSVFAYAGLLPWQLFAVALSESSNSLVGSERLITKVYFPRIIIPAASVIAGMVDFAIAFVVLLGMLFYFRISPGPAIFLLPLFLIFALVTALAVGLWFSALNVQYRDVRYTLTFIIQLWLFLTPVTYPSSLIPARWRILYGLNPMTGVVEGFRWALLGAAPPSGWMFASSVISVLVLFVGGLFYFQNLEQRFADVV